MDGFGALNIDTQHSVHIIIQDQMGVWDYTHSEQ